MKHKKQYNCFINRTCEEYSLMRQIISQNSCIYLKIETIRGKIPTSMLLGNINSIGFLHLSSAILIIIC